MDKPLNYESVCSVVGHLFLESNHELASLREANKKLSSEVEQARAERDAALRTLLPLPEKTGKPEKGQ